jgi:hypothetical protein
LFDLPIEILGKGERNRAFSPSAGFECILLMFIFKLNNYLFLLCGWVFLKYILNPIFTTHNEIIISNISKYFLD